MKNQDIDNLIEDAMSAGSATDAFKEQLLRASTVTLVQGRVLHRRLRTAGFSALALLVTGAVFLCGRLSVPSEAPDRQALAHDVGEQVEGVMVSRELVVWLDAARFFTQLGMEDRAALSYRQASELIPYDVPANQQAGIELQSMLAGISPDHNSEIFGKIIAQNFGG
jgi:hypothetical protein